jgi:hypothetical protein
MDLRPIVLATILFVLMTGRPMSAEFNESDATTAHRQELFPTEIYRRKAVRQREAKPFVDRDEKEQITTPLSVIETSGSGNSQNSSD